jgi:hypothetical protein
LQRPIAVDGIELKNEMFLELVVCRNEAILEAIVGVKAAIFGIVKKS